MIDQNMESASAENDKSADYDVIGIFDQIKTQGCKDDKNDDKVKVESAFSEKRLLENINNCSKIEEDENEYCETPKWD